MAHVTFLSPNKKVTKEIGIGGGFLQRRPLLCTTPPKPVMPAKFLLSAQVFRLAPCRRGNHRKSAGDGAGGFLRVVLRAANQNRSLAGGKRTLVSTRVERELGLAPLSRLLWGTFLAKTRKVQKLN